MKNNHTDKMDLEKAVHLSLQGIKKLWDEGDRIVSVKRIKQIHHLGGSHQNNYILGHALKYLSITQDLLKLHRQSPNRYIILRDPADIDYFKKNDDISEEPSV